MTRLRLTWKWPKGLLPASYTGSDVGRATSGAAATLLGLVHLTAGNSGQAEAALRRVVDSGEYELVSNYANIWGPANKTMLSRSLKFSIRQADRVPAADLPSITHLTFRSQEA
jgi:hypothetical protein